MLIYIKSFFLFLFLLSNFLDAAYIVDTQVPYFYSNFKTIHTEHFDIHYPSKSSEKFFIPQNMKNLAELSAIYFEEAYELLTKDLHSTSYLKIQVVLTDSTDMHNGFATPIPQNLIYLYLTPPLAFSSTSEYDNWLRETIIHELTHIINLSSTRGYSSVLRGIFGTIVSVNGLWPLNIIEGIAVFEETNFSSMGRGRSTLYHTMQRTSVMENTLYDIYKLSTAPYSTEEWPWGMTPYQYGYFLFEHVAKNYNTETPGKISIHNAGVVPYYPSYSFFKYTNKDIPQLWDELLLKKIAFYRTWIDYIKKEKITNIENSFGDGNINRTPSISPDGKLIAYYSLGIDEDEQILIDDLETHKTLHKFKPYNFLTTPMSIEWLDNQKIIFNTVVYEFGSFYYKLATYNLNSGDIDYIENSSRVSYLYPIDDNTLCTIKSKTGVNTFNLEKVSENKIIESKELYTTQLLGRLSKPFCNSIDGKNNFYSIEKTTGKGERIIKILENNKSQILYASKGSVNDFIIKNNILIFIDDSEGIFNLYQMNLSDKKITKISNVLSGAFELEQNKKNSEEFYITYYTSNGYKIGEIKAEPVKINNEFVINNLPVKKLQEPQIPKMEYGNYHAFKTLLPKFWLPWFEYTDQNAKVGANIYGADALFRHQYYISGLYNIDAKKPSFGLTYVNQAFYPIFSFSASNDNTLLVGSAIIEELDYLATMVLPITYFWAAYTGFEYNYTKRDYTGIRTKKEGVFLGISFNETSSSIASISDREQGLSGSIQYGIYPQSMDSTYSEYEVRSNIKFFIPSFWKHHILAVNNDFGYSYGNTRSWYTTGGETQYVQYGKKDFLMRGYPSGYISTRIINVINAEYRFPIFRFNYGHGLFPMFIRNLHGAIISDHAFMGKGFKYDLHSIGAELRSDLLMFYYVPLTLRVGVYKGTQLNTPQAFVGVAGVF